MDAFATSPELALIERDMESLADTLGVMIDRHLANPDPEILIRLRRAQAKARHGAALVRQHRS